MKQKRKKSIKQQKIERELVALKLRRKKLRAALKDVKKSSKKTARQTKRIFRTTEKRRKQIARQKPKHRKPLLPRISIKFKPKKRKRKIVRSIPKKNLREFRGNIARYHSLVRDYIEKQDKKFKRNKYIILTFKDKRGRLRAKKYRKYNKRLIMQSEDMKQLVKDLHRGRLLKERGLHKEGNRVLLNALKKTSRRDGIPDNVPVGESPK